MTEDVAPMIGAVAVVLIHGDRVLALRRARGRVAAGLWETVSGRIGPGEQPRETARREAVEETGLCPRLDEGPVDAYVAMRGADPMLVVVYRGTVNSAEVRLSTEHDACAWVHAGELAALGAPARLVEAVRRCQPAG